MLTIVTWFWGEKYGEEYVARLAAGLSRNLAGPWRFVVAADRALAPDRRWPANHWTAPIPAEDEYLLGIKGCFARLRMFDPAWQRDIGLAPGDRLICIDLDAIVTGPLGDAFARSEPFLILQGANAANPCPYNGSVIGLQAGAHPEVWADFSLEAVKAAPYYEFHDDQGWLWHKIPDAAGWTAGGPEGIYAYQKPGWPRGEALPPNARLVVFPGSRDPARVTHLDWVRRHWLEA